MNIDPIQERTNLINKLIKWAKSLFKKKPKYEKIIKTTREAAYKNYEAYSKFGMSCEEAGKALVTFNQVMSPNKMREICDLKRIEDGETTLYADGKPYCIINRKGDIVWQKQIL